MSRCHAGCAVLAVALLAATHAQPAVPLETILDRLGAYLLAYEPELSALTAEETFVQEVGGISSRSAKPSRRLLVSDVAFMRLPGGGPWLGYRDVRRVDNKPIVRTTPRLLERLASSERDDRQVAITIAIESAQHSLGSARTTNMPTLPLELMQPRNRARFRFEAAGRARVGRTETVRVTFAELDRPSIIRSWDGKDMMSRGTLWVEPSTGQLWRADVDTRDPKKIGAADWRLRVEFVEDKALQMLVPRVLEEWFQVAYGRGFGQATYSNFRRFTTSARIVP